MPLGQVKRATPARVSATHREHIGEVGLVAQAEGERGPLRAVVLDAKLLLEVVSKPFLPSDPQRLLAHFQRAIAVLQVRVGQLEDAGVARANVRQQRDGRLCAKAQALGAQVAHVVEIEALVGVGPDVAVVGTQQEEAALLDHHGLDEPRPHRRAPVMEDALRP